MLTLTVRPSPIPLDILSTSLTIRVIYIISLDDESAHIGDDVVACYLLLLYALVMLVVQTRISH